MGEAAHAPRTGHLVSLGALMSFPMSSDQSHAEPVEATRTTGRARKRPGPCSSGTMVRCLALGILSRICPDHPIVREWAK